jgi:hypothetical protein
MEQVKNIIKAYANGGYDIDTAAQLIDEIYNPPVEVVTQEEPISPEPQPTPETPAQ